jgi:hypothetical protein
MTLFVDFIELNRTDAEIISRTLLSALEEYGLAT